MTYPNVHAKFLKVTAHLTRFNQRLNPRWDGAPSFMLDEMITFEHCRSTRPLALPILIDRESMFVIDARCASIRPFGRMTERRRQAIRKDERRNGRRADRSYELIESIFERVRKQMSPATTPRFITDKKTTYPATARRIFRDFKFTFEQHPGRAPRISTNPLHRINITNAMARDLNGRLRRRSWLVSKKAERLDLQLEIFKAYRNFVRPRFNGEKATPGERLSVIDRRLSFQDLVAWREFERPTLTSRKKRPQGAP